MNSLKLYTLTNNIVPITGNDTMASRTGGGGGFLRWKTDVDWTQQGYLKLRILKRIFYLWIFFYVKQGIESLTGWECRNCGVVII